MYLLFTVSSLHYVYLIIVNVVSDLITAGILVSSLNNIKVSMPYFFKESLRNSKYS